MKKILLWIGMGCAVYVPLVASSGGHNKKALVVAGYVRQTSPHYVPPYLMDCIYRYWMAGKRTKIGDAFRWQGPDHFDSCRRWTFVPPTTLVILGFQNGIGQVLVGWDVQEDKQVFTKGLPYGKCATCMLYIPHDKGDCLVIHCATKKCLRVWLKDVKTTFFDNESTCRIARLVKAPDDKGFVSVEGHNTIESLAYWHVGTCKLERRFHLCIDGGVDLSHDKEVYFIDADRFAFLASYANFCQGTDIYVYHRKQEDLDRKVHVKMNTIFDAYHSSIRCWIRPWIIVPVTRGFWVYDMCHGTQSYASYPWEHEKPYKVLPLDESQFVLVTKRTQSQQNQGATFKASICDIVKVGSSIHVTTWESKVLDDNVGAMWSHRIFMDTYGPLVLLGVNFLFKTYLDNTMAVHTLT